MWKNSTGQRAGCSRIWFSYGIDICFVILCIDICFMILMASSYKRLWGTDKIRIWVCGTKRVYVSSWVATDQHFQIIWVMHSPPKLFILAYFWSFCWYMGPGSSSAVVVPGMCSSNCIWLFKLQYWVHPNGLDWLLKYMCFNEVPCKLLSTCELMGSRLICLIYGLINSLFQLIPVMQINRSFVAANIIVDKIMIATHWSMLMLVVEQNTVCMLQQNCVISWILLNGRYVIIYICTFKFLLGVVWHSRFTCLALLRHRQTTEKW